MKNNFVIGLLGVILSTSPLQTYLPFAEHAVASTYAESKKNLDAAKSAAEHPHVPNWTTRYDFGAPVDKKSPEAKTAREVVITIHAGTYKFVPNVVKVKKNEVINFVVKNETSIKHEFVIGDKATLDYAKEEIADGEEEENPEGFEVEIEPGKTANLYWHFIEAGEVMIICLIPGHEEHGMKGKVIVK